MIFCRLAKLWNDAKVPELYSRVLFTLMMVLIFRVSSFIPVPGINSEIAEQYFGYLQAVSGMGSGVFQVVDAFSGGAFSQMTVFALGVGPYISASIFVQLAITMMPGIQVELREVPEIAQKKISSWTRYCSLGLSLLQSFMFARYTLYMNSVFPGVILPYMMATGADGATHAKFMFFLVFGIVMTAGSLSLMWICEQISQNGVGNGISIVVSVGILASFPRTIYHALDFVGFFARDTSMWSELMFITLRAIGLFLLLGLITITTLYLCLGQLNVPVMYARKTVGNKSFMGSGAPYIPLRLNYVGVIPVIFTSSILMFPATVSGFWGNRTFGSLVEFLSPGGVPYLVCYSIMIVFFSYFWTSLQFNASKIAGDMQRNGAFIPGVKQGKATIDHLDAQMQFVTFTGAIMLALVATSPWICAKVFGIDKIVGYFLGGTSLLLVVGSTLDTMRQVESFMLMKSYDGMVSGIKGKRKSKY